MYIMQNGLNYTIMNDKAYENYISMSDGALIQLIGKFVKHHRLHKNRTQEQVSYEAGISRSTLSLLERGQAVTVPTLIQVLRVLDLLYVLDVFQVSEEVSPIAYAKMQRNKRKRAWSVNEGDVEEQDLEW